MHVSVGRLTLHLTRRVQAAAPILTHFDCPRPRIEGMGAIQLQASYSGNSGLSRGEPRLSVEVAGLNSQAAGSIRIAERGQGANPVQCWI